MTQKWIKLGELRRPGMRRVLEGLSLVSSEMQAAEDEKLDLPPAHLRSESAGRGHVDHGG